jgi:uncharacterized membrane protein YhaH (DUF805 family)
MNTSFFGSSKGRLLFSPRGRIPRTDFWVGLIVVAGMTTLAILLNGNHVRGGALGEFFALVTAIAVLSPYCLIAIVIKRLHDLDMSGWHVLTLLAGMLIAVLVATAYRGLQQGLVDEEWQAFWTGFCIAAGPVIVLLAYLFGKLGFARGIAGGNRFGVTAHPGCADCAAASPSSGVARAVRIAVRALRPLRRPVSTMEQRAA